ncbi:FecR family protein [Pedobacter alpinus]|uniref:FecR family protein n=1 Tax=Pedobacter alpinus TaxID=1590643 RepID=A0ABW5TXW4_9SPHI
MIDELIIKCLLEESSETEKLTLKNWLDRDAENQKYFEEMELIWKTSKKLGLQHLEDEDIAWKKFNMRVAETKPKQAKLLKLSWINVAACLIVMLTLSWFTYQQLKSPSQMVGQTLANTKIISLPDGSTVTLNKYTRINFPEKFTGEYRGVKLVAGEAFFSIKPDKDSPFVIQTENTSIRVVGTSFNVKCTDEKTEVTVETGVVEVTKKERSIELKPGEKVVVDDHYSSLQKQNVTDSFYNYYITKEFVANSTPLWRLVEVLNDTYDVKIIIKNERVKNLKLTTTFKDESLESIIDVITETFQLKATKENNLIILQ